MIIIGGLVEEPLEISKLLKVFKSLLVTVASKAERNKIL